jgi:nitroreductase
LEKHGRILSNPIPYDVQARILDAAIRAPNINQEWRFILVDDPDVKSRLARFYLQASERLFNLQPFLPLLPVIWYRIRFII